MRTANPAAATPGETDPNGASPPAQVKSQRLRSAPIDALVAEDHPVNQLLARRMLEKFGCVVTIAAHGREALEYASSRRFDIIFMDMQMPEMDGLEATRWIRTLPGHDPEHVPIIAMTANARVEDRSACLAAGMNAFLSKPIESDALRGVLLDWVMSPERAGSGDRPGVAGSDDNPGAACPAELAEAGPPPG